MGILTKDEIKKINAIIDDLYSGINLVPVMKKENRTAVLDKINNVVYLILDDDFDKCYKKQKKIDFIASIDGLKKEGWVIL